MKIISYICDKIVKHLENDLESKFTNCNNGLQKIIQEQKYLQEKVTNIEQILRFNVDRQHYLNSYFNPEILLLEKHSEGDLLLCGNYGECNAGDELMLQTMLEYLEKYCKKHVTVMLVPDRYYDITNFKDVSFIHYPQTCFDFELLAEKFDEVVFGGGALIEDEFYQEVYDFGIPICRTLVDLSLRFIEKKKKVFCIGLSTALTLKNTEYIGKLQRVIDGAEHFSVRDIYSICTLKNARIDCKNVKLENDIVYANCRLESFIKNTRCESIEDDKVFKIGLVYIFNEETIQKLEIVLTMLKKCMDDKTYEINVICFSGNRHNDENYYYHFLERKQNVNLVPYSGDLETIIKTVLSQDLIINMRYHSMLLSLSLGMPSINIMYDTHKHYTNKITYVLEQFGLDINKCIKFSELNDGMDDINSRVVENQNNKVLELLNNSQNQLYNVVKKM